MLWRWYENYIITIITVFTFDYSFEDDVTTKQIYKSVASPIVRSSVEGINGTIFAYGQTSSGRVY